MTTVTADPVVVLEAEGVVREYRGGDGAVLRVLAGVDLAVRAGLTETWSYTLSSPELEERLRAGGGAPAPGYATLTSSTGKAFARSSHSVT